MLFRSVFVTLLMVPWGIRNFRVFHQIVILTPRTTAITSKLWGENLAKEASHFSDVEAKIGHMQSRYKSGIDFGNQYGITPREYGKNESRIFAFFHFWQPTFFKPTFIQYGFRGIKWSLKHNIVSLLFYGIFLPFYIIGMFLLYKRKLFIGLYLAFIPLIHILIHAYMVWPLERYRSPVTFIVVMIGIWAGIEIYKKLEERLLQPNSIHTED